MHLRNHKKDGPHSRYKFIMKGSMCKRTVEEFTDTLTAGQIKKLSGLDDIKVLKGHKSFISVCRLTDKY